MKVTEEPVINITLTLLQEAEIETVIAMLEGVKEMYEKMNND
ncbi:hypothetical protein [Methanococcoides methylutens]|nr:hypothetical protein [Methanococcoides methylutens]